MLWEINQTKQNKNIRKNNFKNENYFKANKQRNKTYKQIVISKYIIKLN